MAATLVAVAPTAARAATAPAPVSALAAAPGEAALTVTWHDPVGDPVYDHVVVRIAKGGTPPATPTDGTAVALTDPATQTSVVVPGLQYHSYYAVSVFTSDAAGTAFSAAQSAVAAPTGATVSLVQVQPHSAAYGRSVTVIGRVLRRADSAPLGWQRVVLQYRWHGGTAWSYLAAKMTDSTGRARFPVTLRRNTDVRIVYPATTFYTASTSPTAVAVEVPALTFSAPAIALVRHAFTLSGSAPGAAGADRLYLQRYTSGAWRDVAVTQLAPSTSYHFSRQFNAPVTVQYRTRIPATVRHAAVTSRAATISVGLRTLSSGMSGSDVAALQHQLAALHYDVGAITGTYGFDTVHAVIAFEKVNGLPRDGVVGPTVRTRLAHPTGVTLRAPRSGFAVEVNKTLQVVVFQQGGQVVRIIDASTGGGYYYYQNGVRYLAYTPEGHFSIQWKINAWHTSPLGQMYRPSYFFEGYAIHGDTSVPPYPASHGCVRITNPAVDRYYSWLTIGTPVYVYH